MTVCHPDTVIWPDATITDDLTDEQVEVALALAWTTLQTLTAYQVAICPITVRPCKAACRQGSYSYDYVSGPGPAPAFFPQVRSGVWTNLWCGHSGDCACSEVQEIVLPGPVGDIVTVQINGEELDPTAYRVDNHNRLVRQDGEGWPVCQDMNVPDWEDNTFSVTYYHGAVADVTVRWAAGVLAQEYIAAITGGECRLPEGTTQIVRQGLTIQVEASMFINGRTDIKDVDSVIERFNPYHQKMPSEIFSLDSKPARTTTWSI